MTTLPTTGNLFSRFIIGTIQGPWRAALISVVLVFIFTAGLFLNRLELLAGASTNIGRSHNTIFKLEALLGSLRDIETGFRGFLISQNREYLEPTMIGRDALPALLTDLSVLYSSNPAQYSKFLIVKKLAMERLDDIKNSLRIWRDTSHEAALRQAREGQGNRVMEELRERVAEMKRIEELTLSKNLASFDRTRQSSQFLMFVTSVFMLVLSLLAIYFARREGRNASSLVLATNEKLRIEEALRSSEERLRTALLHLPLRVYATDLTGRYVWIHSSPSEMGNGASLLGKRDDEIFPPDQVEDLMALEAEVIFTRKPSRRVLRLPFNGSPTFYDVTIDPIFDSTNKISGLNISAFDIQPQIEVQEALKKSEEEFRLITEVMPQIVWTADAAGSPDYYNSRWYDYTGMEHGAKLNCDWKEYIHPDDHQQHFIKWSHSVKTEVPYDNEFRFRNANNGEYRWFIGRAVPVVGMDSKVTRWFGTCTDIHEQKTFSEERELLLDSERSARDQSERAMRARDHFVATLSHELRGPLNAILGWVQLLQTKPDDKEILHRGIDVIEKNTHIQAKLISELFDYHRILAEKVTLEYKIIDLTQLITAAVESMVPSSQAKNLKVKLDIGMGSCEIPGDPQRITQAFCNILGNSIKFTPEGGEITVSLSSDPNFATLVLRDTGIGISKIALGSIFDRYKHSGVTKKQEGLGLGLAIAKSFIELHHGTLEVFSEGSGKGTQFTIKLPGKKSEVATLPKEIGSVPLIHNRSLSGVKVLIVEDQEDSREAVARILTDRGAIVLVAENGQQALLMLQEQTPNLLLSDISMPGMDGYTLMSQVKELFPSVTGIALTAFSRVKDQERAIASGFSRHLTKPVNISELITTIWDLTNQSQSV